jgi:hypothetical protein
MMLRSSKAMWWAGGAALWCAQGCMTLDDLTMKEDAGSDGEVVVDDDAASPESDAEAVDGEDAAEPERGSDSGVLADASQPGLDAGPDADLPPKDSGVLIHPDGWVELPDATVPPAPGCTSNANCESDEYCASSAVCLPKCNADGACLVHQMPAGRGVAQFASDDQALYFSSIDGTNVDSGEIWRREPGQAPTLVANQVGAWGRFEVRDGHAYFRRGARFFRAKVAPQSPAEELYVVPGSQDTPWTIGNGFLVASVLDGFWFGSLDGKQALRKIETELVGSPAEVRAFGDRFYFIANTRVNDYALSRVKSVRMVEPYAIEDASPVIQGHIEGGLVEVRPPHLYFGFRYPQRLNLLTGESESYPTGWGPGHSLDSRYLISGDWIYAFNPGYERPAGSSVDRYFLGKASISQQLLPPRPREESAASSIMGVMGKRFYSAAGAGIYEKLLPAAPCESQAQCDASEFCGPESECMPRCYEDGSCLAFQGTRRIVAIHADGAVPHVVLDSTRDGVGNPKPDAELWQVVPQGEPRLVTNQIGDPYAVVLKGGFAYYRRGANLYRLSLLPGSTEQLLYALPGGGTSSKLWVIGDTFVAVSTSAGIAFGSLDGQVPLRSIVGPSEDDGAPRLLAQQDRIYFAYNASAGTTGYRSIRMIEPYAVEEVAGVQQVPEANVRHSALSVRGSHLYFQSTPVCHVDRIDITDGTREAVAVPQAFDPPSSLSCNSALLGDWVYTSQTWSTSSGTSDKAYLRRCSTLSLGTCQELTSQRSSSTTGVGSLLGVAGNKLYTTPNDEARAGLLYELLLPPPP